MDYTAAIAQLAQMGLPGIVIIGLFLALREKDKQLTDSQEKRIAEGRESVAATERNTAALTALTDVIKERRA